MRDGSVSPFPDPNAVVQDIPILDRNSRDEAEVACQVNAMLCDGPGVMVLRGFADEPSWADARAPLLSLAGRIGMLLPQNEKGDLVNSVTFAPGSHVRGAKTRRELPFHTDLGSRLPDVFFLYCVRQAAHGGNTILVDGLGILEQLKDEVLELLAGPFPFDISDNARNSADAVIRRPVLVHDPGGRIDVTYNRARIHRGYRALGLHLPPERGDALDALDAALANPRLWCQILLRKGDLLCVDNHRFLHARGQFSDEGTESRLLLRVWLAVSPSGAANH